MAAEPTLEPTIAQEEEEEENDEGEDSDVYELEGDEEANYQPEEDEDDEDNEGASDVEPENMTALLLGKQNGTTIIEEDDEEDEEYQGDGEGTAENPVDPSPAVAGSKRSVDALSEGDACGDEEDEDDEGETVAKKVRV